MPVGLQNPQKDSLGRLPPDHGKPSRHRSNPLKASLLRQMCGRCAGCHGQIRRMWSWCPPTYNHCQDDRSQLPIIPTKQQSSGRNRAPQTCLRKSFGKDRGSQKDRHQPRVTPATSVLRTTGPQPTPSEETALQTMQNS